MAVKLRLMRMGKKNRPYYRVCAFDSRKPRGGQYIESIGHYDPLIEDDKKKITISKERAAYWLSVGAQPTETVFSFLKQLEVPGLFRLKKLPRKRPPKAASKEAKKRPKAATAKKKKTRKKKETKSTSAE